MENARYMDGSVSRALENSGWLHTDIQKAPDSKAKAALERILVVDDDKGVRDAMAGLLSDLGYDVVVAGDGEEALILFQGSTFGLVLTDLNMPGMDGWRLAEQIKKDSSATVVLITASDRHSVEERIGKSHVDSVLFKPFRVEDLLAVVVKAFTPMA